MDFDVINITKIKDGFFIGDEATAANLDVIIQFKITHMINAAGTQVINSWESIGIKYLTLNWSESPNQNLFDQKDEIANRLINFIEESLKNGEGILIHSLRGQDRACLVVIIYFMKKYRWSLSKALEYLMNKKFDVEIPKYFMNQLNLFENRVNKTGTPLTNGFEDEPKDDTESDELLIRNTFLNGLPMKGEKKEKPLNLNTRRIQWSDNNKNKRDLLCSYHNKDILLKDVKTIVSHKGLSAKKPILKRSCSVEIKRCKFDLLSSPSLKSEKEGSSVSSSFINNSDLKSSFREEASLSDRKSKGEVTNIIIAPNMKNYINNNIKNIYINNNTDLNKISFMDNNPVPTSKASNTKDFSSSSTLGFKSENIVPTNKVSKESKSALQNNFSITNMIE
jgi:hypothetical protein